MASTLWCTEITQAQLTAKIALQGLDEGRMYNITDANKWIIATTNSEYEVISGMVKKYTVLLTQAGATAPVATELEDTITGLAWARTAAGTYTLTKTAAFPENKTLPVSRVIFDAAGNKITITRTSANVITVVTYAVANLALASDGVMTAQEFKIEVYN